MIKRIVKGLIMPVLLSGLLLLWEFLTVKDFRVFWGIVLFFIAGFILTILLKKIIGYSFHIFLIFYFVISLIICLLITPSPYKRWMEWSSLSKNPSLITISGLDTNQEHHLVFLKDAVTLKEAMYIQSFAAGAGDNGARGMVPVVDKNYKQGDSIMAFAAFTSYIDDKGNDSWFFLDKDEEDYAEAWIEPVVSAKIVKDTSRINLYLKMMEQATSRHNLVVSSRVIFLQSNFPSDDLKYVAHKLMATGIVLLIIAAIINTKRAINRREK